MTGTIEGERPAVAVETTLRELASRVARSRALRHGDIVFRLGGQGRTELVLAAEGDGVRVAPLGSRPNAPLIEVFGDAEAVRSILAKEVDARKRFLAGGIRVRGDLRYLSDLALELGLLSKPL